MTPAKMTTRPTMLEHVARYLLRARVGVGVGVGVRVRARGRGGARARARVRARGRVGTRARARARANLACEKQQHSTNIVGSGARLRHVMTAPRVE